MKNTAWFHLTEVSKAKLRDQRVEGWFQQLGGDWHGACMSNGYKILVATWKSSRDLMYNTVHGVTGLKGHIKAWGKAGVNFLHLHLAAPPFSDCSRTGYGTQVPPGAPCRRKEAPSTMCLRWGGRIHSEALTGKSLNEASGRVMNHDQSKCHKTY